MDKGEIFAKIRVDINFVQALTRGLLTSCVYLASIKIFRGNHTRPLINCDLTKNFYQLSFIYGTIHNMNTNEIRLKFNTCVTIHKQLTNILTYVSQVELEKVNKKLATANCC